MKGNKIESHLNKLRSEPELWDIFTRREEYNPHFRDKYGRFPYYMSNNRSIFDPRVSKYLVENGLEMEYLDGKKFAVCLTHDIDAVYYPRGASIIAEMGKYLLHGQLRDALKRPFYNIHKIWNPIWNFREIMDLEEAYGAKSTFFVMGLEEGDQDINYRAEELSCEMGNIVDRGWEVGLHGGHEAYENPEALKRQKANLEMALGEKVVGYRNHYLRFKVPETWELLEKGGFKYDATFGYPDCVGFRNGMCHPFKPYDLRTCQEIDILEIPLITMDGTLDQYMRLDMRTAWDVIRQLIDTVERYHGVFTLLWHNTYIEGERLKLFEKVLEYCQEKGAWMTSGENIAVSSKY
jgi:peptidoglycan/xylan/chitin deacetylase (PgdA/CDA1 family)